MSITREELMDKKLQDMIRMCDNRMELLEKNICINRNYLKQIKNIRNPDNQSKIQAYHEIIDGDIHLITQFEFAKSMLKEVQEVKK